MKNKLKIVITAAGAPQAPTLIRHLKGNGEREVEIVALDMNGEACGRFLADAFYRIPPAGTEGYRERIIEVIKRERPDAFLNSSGADVPFIAAMRGEIEALGTVVLASDPQAIEIANNKFLLYSALKGVAGVEVPDFRAPSSFDEFLDAARDMGYPDRNLCFKPHVSKGSRGFRILSESFDRRDLLLNHKPVSRYMTMEEFRSIFGGSPDFPKLLLMEVASGEECDVMALAYEGEALLVTAKSRESHRWGVIDRGEHIERPELVRSTEQIIRHIPLSYNISIQFIGGKLIEINPRTSTFIYQEDLNEPWLAVKLALGMISPGEVREHRSRIRFGRRMVRFMDQIFFDPDGKWSY
jgi:carbamoyl-phosphate synthase large subunit